MILFLQATDIREAAEERQCEAFTCRACLKLGKYFFFNKMYADLRTCLLTLDLICVSISVDGHYSYNFSLSHQKEEGGSVVQLQLCPLLLVPSVKSLCLSESRFTHLGGAVPHLTHGVLGKANVQIPTKPLPEATMSQTRNSLHLSPRYG